MSTVFLDRDGVICANRTDHVKSWAEFHFLPGAVEGIVALTRAGCQTVVVTNQAAVHRGLVSAAEVEAIHRQMVAAVAAAGGRIDLVLYCPHRADEQCRCRKPQPGLLLEGARRLGIDLAEFVRGGRLLDGRAGGARRGLPHGARPHGARRARPALGRGAAAARVSGVTQPETRGEAYLARRADVAVRHRPPRLGGGAHPVPYQPRPVSSWDPDRPGRSDTRGKRRPMELVRYLKVVRKSWWILVLLVISAAGSTTYFALDQAPEFASTTTLLLNPGVPNDMLVYYQSSASASLADSYTALIHSETFADAVAKALPFPMDPGSIIGAVSTDLVANTLFYRIQVTSDSPTHAQQLADTVTKVFISANADQQQQQAQNGGGAQTVALQQLADEIDKLNTQIGRYNDAITTLEAQPVSAARDTQLTPLYDRLSSLEQTRTNALVAQANLTTNQSGNSAVVFDPAQGGHQLSRHVLTQVAVAAAAALVLGIGLAFLREYLDYTIRSPEYMEEVFGLPPVAAVGVLGGGSQRRRWGRGKRKGSGTSRMPGAASGASRLAGRNLVTLEQPRAVESEIFRSLRTNIQFAGLERPVRTMVVTSAGPGEGKTFTAANLAVVMAQAGKRVILVDTDLRRPGVHKLFDLPNAAGFTTLVLGDGTVRAELAQPMPGLPGLKVITSGPLPPNPSELLGAGQTAELMNRLAQAADIVIYDAPPAGAVTDPLILAARVDAVVFVVNAGVARRDVVARIRRNLQATGVRTLLPVLNRVKMRDVQGAYYYYYYHSYSTDPGAPRTNGHQAAAPTPDVVLAAPGGPDDRPPGRGEGSKR